MIRLEPGTTKNDEGRLVYLTPELVDMLRAQEERIQILDMRLDRPVPFLFPYLSGEHERGTGSELQEGLEGGMYRGHV